MWSLLQSGPGFLNLDATDISSWMILCHEDCPVHWRMCHSILALSPLNANGSPIPTVVTARNISRQSLEWGRGHGLFWLRTAGLDREAGA